VLDPEEFVQKVLHPDSILSYEPPGSQVKKKAATFIGIDLN
jgi:hypothetical protein